MLLKPDRNGYNMSTTHQMNHPMSPNEPAFPSNFGPNDKYEGMTLRAYFAGQALRAILSNNPRSGDWEGFAKDSTDAADALIAELNKPQ